MADIFVSYKREDQEQKGRVVPIVRALEAEGFDVFFDVKIPPGSTWEQVLQSKISMAKCVLVLWSEASVASDWVKEEAEIAKGAGKIIPVFLDPVSAPFGFSRIEGANLVGWNGDLENDEWKNLVRAIKDKIGDGTGTVQPQIKSVPMPVERKPAASGNGGKFAILGALAIVLAVGGYFGFQYLNAPSGGTVERPPAVDSDAAFAAKERDAFDRAVKDGSRSVLFEFLETYPESRYNDRIKKLIAQLDEKPTITPTPIPTATLRPIPGRVIDAVRVEEDCVEYSGAYKVSVASSGQSATVVDASGRAAPLSAAGSNAVTEMNRAVLVLGKYGLTQQCFVGRPNAPLTYWKTSDGDLPTGSLDGEDCVMLFPESLSPKLKGGMYYLLVGSSKSSILRFESKENAENAVAIMKKYKATQLCYVGGQAPTMMYMKK